MTAYYNWLSYFLSAPAIAAIVTIIFSLSSPDIFLSVVVGFLFLVIIPILPVFYFFEQKLIDIDVHDRKKRTIFFLMAIISYITASVIFYYLNYHTMFSISMAYIFVTTAVMIINLFWKISVHSAGVAGPTTALVYVFGKELIPLYIFTIIIIYIRLKLRAHNLIQLIAGSVVAIAVTFLTYLFFY